MSLNRGLTAPSKLLTVALALENSLLFLAGLGTLGDGRLWKALLTHDSSLGANSGFSYEAAGRSLYAPLRVGEAGG